MKLPVNKRKLSRKLACSALFGTLVFAACRGDSESAKLTAGTGITADQAATPMDQPHTFAAYVHQYQAPEFFDSNTQAFEARLKLLDSAPAGSIVKIASFTFDNGRAIRSLATHVCQAEARGLQVEILVDSKSGDQPGLPSPYDTSDDAKVQEDLLQYLANCGAKVFVHNHLESFITVFGEKLPNIFLDPTFDHSSFSYTPPDIFNLPILLGRINQILDRVAGVTQPQLAGVGVKSSSRDLLGKFKTFALNYLTLVEQSKKSDAVDANGGNSRSLESAINNLRSAYFDILQDPLLAEVTPEQMKTALPLILKAATGDADIMRLRYEIRRFNRLNHRKLFLVQTPDGKDGCMFLGGRNLGDHYLMTTSVTYLDGDVLLCRHQSAETNQMLDAAIGSFENLKTDASDPVLGMPNDNFVRPVQPVPNFTFAHLAFPIGTLPPGAQVGPYPGRLPVLWRVLIPPVPWGDETAIHGDLTLAGSHRWRFLTAAWDPATDQVAQALLDMINRERKEIYLETAYGDLSTALKTAIENALKRGVKVNYVSNSFTTSDGGSKVIRILMANWIAKMTTAYPNSLHVQFTAAAAGHMTHFKGAAFACQALDGGAQTRSYIVGSHNFHGRSGFDDKEHALTWQEPADQSCVSGFDATADVVNARRKYYADLSTQIGTPVLESPSGLFEELAAVWANSGINKDENRTQSKIMAGALIRVFYDVSDQLPPTLHDPERVKKLLDLVDDGGIHDLLGLVL